MRNSMNDAINKLLASLTFPDTGCWICTLSPAMRYPHIACSTVRMSVHRFAHELFIGPIPEGHDVHHKCEVPRCCNPDHLQSLTEMEHYRLHKVKTHCKHGHEFTPENTYVWSGRPGQQMCRECARRNDEVYRERRPQKADGRKNRTHCRYGHEFTPENTYVWSNGTRSGKHCRICLRRRKKEHRARQTTF